MAVVWMESSMVVCVILHDAILRLTTVLRNDALLHDAVLLHDDAYVPNILPILKTVVTE